MKKRPKQIALFVSTIEKLLNPAAGTYGRTLHAFKAMPRGKRRLLGGAQAEGHESLYEAIQELPLT